MPSPRLTLYMDVVSPFGYLAYYLVRHSPVFATCDVSYVPVFLGGIMQACGNTPPIKIKNKDKWIDVERLRWARQFNIPMVDQVPEGFPPMTLAVQRVLAAISVTAPQKLAASFDALLHTFWVGSEANIAKPEVFGPVLESVLGKEGTAEVIKKSTTPEGKKLLMDNTDRAIKSGAFGLPWFECTNVKGETQGFWGFDHLAQVALFLGLDRDADKGFRAMM